METISSTLFWIANSLLIPDIILLILLFIRSLLLLGSFYNQYMTKIKNDKLLDEPIRSITSDEVGGLKDLLPGKDNSLYIKYMRKLMSREPNEAYSEFVLSGFEDESEKDLSLSRILAKLGPVLGLIGTLIAMSPALVGLSTGDISGMAYNMQVVFATTVVGLVISAIGLVTLQFKQRWYVKDLNHLVYISQIIHEEDQK